jgi:hypothetical protein
MTNTIQNLYDTLRIAGHKAWLVNDQAQQPPRVFCEMLVDERGRPFVFEVMYSADLSAKADNVQLQADMEGGLQLFLMSLKLPIPLEQKALTQTYRLFNVLNTLLPMGTYLINEDDQSMHMKAAIPCMGDPSFPTVIEVLDMLTAFATQMTPIIEKVGSGTVALEEAVAQMQAGNPT